MYKHWKEAEKRAAELKAEIEALDTAIKAEEAEARNEETTVERREALIVSIGAAAEKRAALMADREAAAKAMATLKAEEQRQIGLLDSTAQSRVMERAKEVSEMNVLETRAYELAWAKGVRTGDYAEARQLIETQTPESAGVLVPHTLVNAIEDTLRKGGRLVSLCTISTIKGITSYPIAGNRTDPDWHDETGTTPKGRKTVAFSLVSIEPQFVAEILETTRKFEADSIEAFWDWLLAELPDALMRKLDREILFGAQSGKNGIRGVLTNTDDAFVATLPNHTLNFNTANAAVALLDDSAASDVVAVMNKQTFFNNVMGMTGNDGHPIWTQATSNLGRPAFFFGGYPVVFSSDLPTYDAAAADQTYMLLGSFNAMRLNFPLGMNPRLIRDEITRKEDNIIEYLSEIYVGGNITRLERFVKVTK